LTTFTDNAETELVHSKRHSGENITLSQSFDKWLQASNATCQCLILLCNYSVS